MSGQELLLGQRLRWQSQRAKSIVCKNALFFFKKGSTQDRLSLHFFDKMMIRAAVAFGVFAASVDAFAPTLPSSMRTRHSPVAVSMATRAETMQPFEERRALKVRKPRDPRNPSCTAPAPDRDCRPAPGPWLIRVHPLCHRHFRV
jgi:hypothetical protein